MTAKYDIIGSNYAELRRAAGQTGAISHPVLAHECLHDAAHRPPPAAEERDSGGRTMGVGLSVSI